MAIIKEHSDFTLHFATHHNVCVTKNTHNMEKFKNEKYVRKKELKFIKY